LYDVTAAGTGTFTLTQTVGGSATATTPTLSYDTLALDVAYFDITGAVAGDTFVVKATTITGSNVEQFAGITFDTAMVAVADELPALVDFSYDPDDGSSQVSIKGAPGARYKLVEASDLDFSSPDRDPVPLIAPPIAGTLDGNVVILDGEGNATVEFNLGTTKASTFLRAEEAP
jgi:hypothetical protein